MLAMMAGRPTQLRPSYARAACRGRRSMRCRPRLTVSRCLHARARKATAGRCARCARRPLRGDTGDAAGVAELSSGLLALPCAHVFHARCIRPWLSRDTRCPSCRQSSYDPNHEQQPDAHAAHARTQASTGASTQLALVPRRCLLTMYSTVHINRPPQRQTGRRAKSGAVKRPHAAGGGRRGRPARSARCSPAASAQRRSRTPPIAEAGGQRPSRD